MIVGIRVIRAKTVLLPGRGGWFILGGAQSVARCRFCSRVSTNVSIVPAQYGGQKGPLFIGQRGGLREVSLDEVLDLRLCQRPSGVFARLGGWTTGVSPGVLGLDSA